MERSVRPTSRQRWHVGALLLASIPPLAQRKVQVAPQLRKIRPEADRFGELRDGLVGPACGQECAPQVVAHDRIVRNRDREALRRTEEIRVVLRLARVRGGIDLRVNPVRGAPQASGNECQRRDSRNRSSVHAFKTAVSPSVAICTALPALSRTWLTVVSAGCVRRREKR